MLLKHYNEHNNLDATNMYLISLSLLAHKLLFSVYYPYNNSNTILVLPITLTTLTAHVLVLTTVFRRVLVDNYSFRSCTVTHKSLHEL